MNNPIGGVNPREVSPNSHEESLSPGISLADEMSQALQGDRQSINAIIHSESQPTVVETAPANESVEKLMKLVEANSRIMALQKEVFDQRLNNEQVIRERLLLENELLKLKSQMVTPYSASTHTSSLRSSVSNCPTTTTAASTPFPPSMIGRDNLTEVLTGSTTQSVYTFVAPIPSTTTTPTGANSQQVPSDSCSSVPSQRNPSETYAVSSSWTSSGTQPESARNRFVNIHPEPVNIRAAYGPPSSRTHELPTFSGRAEEWPLFASAYYSTTEAFAYSDLENLLRLQRSLKGEAKNAVESLLIYPKHVRQVMDTLEFAFGRPEQLIRSQIAIARNLPAITESHLDQLSSFAMTVQNLAVFLDNENTKQYLHNPTLMDELVAKLPMSRRVEWARESLRFAAYPTILNFAQWLTNEAKIINMVAVQTMPFRASSTSTQNHNKRPPNKHVLIQQDNIHTEPKCSFCAEDHKIESCKRFLRLKVEYRWHEVSKRPLCYCCLYPGHLLPACDKKEKCGVEGCSQWHNPLLHRSGTNGADNTTSRDRSRERQRERSPSQSRLPRQQTPGPSSSRTQSPQPGPSRTMLSCHDDESTRTLLFRVVPVTLHGPHRSINTFALLDEGSSVSLIDDELADALQLDGEVSQLNLQWFGSQSSTERSRKVALEISSSDRRNSMRFKIGDVRTIRKLKLPTQSVDRDKIIKNNPHLRQVPFPTYQNAQPKILLGLDHHYLGLPIEICTNDERQGIVAARTNLGWIVYGSDQHSSRPGAVLLHINNVLEYEQQQLNELVRAHFTTEDFGVKIPLNAIESDEIIRARRLLSSTTNRVAPRSFEPVLLWQREDVVLPDSYPMVLKCLKGIELKIRRNKQFAQSYRQQINSYIEKEYARELTDAESSERNNRTWYLPHFATSNINKPERIRLVFDAAAAVHGTSLNSALLAGPDINIPLTRILFKFRIGLIGVCADIQEMFHQVKIRKSDQNSQRFLWRDGNSHANPKTFVMQVMTFGATCSPSSAQYVKNTNALEFAEDMPEAAFQIQQHHYVDDFVASFSSAEEAVRVTSDVVELHSRGGFLLRGMKSNCSQVREKFGDNLPSIYEPGESTEKILGMTWDTADDTFRFQTRFARVRPEVVDGSRRPTKREVLSVAMSIFDPFGLLANFTLEAKVILQNLWRLNVGWDDPIPEHLNARWQTWRQQIDKTQLVRVPRCYAHELLNNSIIELHVFADASETAFAAVAYWRIQVEHNVQLAFVAGKVRCAPLKLLSIPRLELQAAVLATRLLKEIIDSHDELTISRTILWTDSETVLKWINSDQRKYKQFVAFRVAEITEITPPSSWRWVPTALNVADDATRSQFPYHFDPDSRWLRGPGWLQEKEEDWPAQLPSSKNADDESETRSKFVGIVAKGGLIDYQRFSKFSRMCRTMAWILRFVSNCRKSNQHRNGLEANELVIATNLICRLVQHETFPDEVAALQSAKPVLKSSRIFILKPYMDEHGILRVHGRTDAADDTLLGPDAKRPILLPSDHRFTRLLVTDQHIKNAHQLVDATIAAVRNQYWIPSLRSLVRSITNSCPTCQIRSASSTVPIQGQLPADRLAAYARPFTNTGLDFFGPVDVTIGRRREKRWVALFTCLSVRAVHLEVAYNLSTDACLLCIRSFCSLRGIPSSIRCDNGTNFVGACNELKSNLNFFDTNVVQNHLSTMGIQWRFNCPANPEAGGIWERLVQSVKRVLSVTLREEAPQIETLRVLLLEAANVVNSRPLTHVEVTPNDPEPITPNHFLLGGPNVCTVPDPADLEPRATRKQWQICRGLTRRFWKQWIRDYLPELTRRSKHYPEEPPLQPDDLVFVCDENLPRRQWKRGRVIDVAMGPDGIVRTATIQTSDGTLRRPITKLAKLRLCSPPMGSTNGGRNVDNLPSATSSSKQHKI